MPFYHKVGKIPRVKHTTFFKDDGKTLYREELFSSKGFSGVYSNKYHIHLPTSVLNVRPLDLNGNIDWPEAIPTALSPLLTHRRTPQISTEMPTRPSSSSSITAVELFTATSGKSRSWPAIRLSFPGQ